jgi:mRNA-degrading endonuclease toxin of MazEF toxin-antitoxin module
MPTTTGCEFGDVVLVPFPFTDQTTTKKRPAVVVSSEAYHRDRPDVILMAVTSQVRPAAGVGETAVQRWKEAGLLKPSVLKPLLATVEKGLVIRKLGKLEDPDRDALRQSLEAILGE